MPDPFARHARTSEDGWGPAPSRSALGRAAAGADPEPAKRPPGRKDTRRFCRGKEGREHVLVLELGQAWPWVKLKTCGWRSLWDTKARDFEVGWACRHREICSACSKVFREPWDLAPEECPDYPGNAAQRAQAEAEVADDRERRAAHAYRYRRRRPPITGRQGYRKPKAPK